MDSRDATNIRLPNIANDLAEYHMKSYILLQNEYIFYQQNITINTENLSVDSCDVM